MTKALNKSNNQQEPEEGEVLPKGLEAKVRRIAFSVTESYSGPFPHPKILNQYKPADKKIIFEQAKKQMEHRHKMEAKVIQSNIDHGAKAIGYAFWITIVMIVSGVVLILAGKSTEGLVAIFAPTSFQGGNYVFHKYKELRNTGDKARKDHNKRVRKVENEQEALQETD